MNGEELLQKYNLKPNDAVLAEGKQKEMYGHPSLLSTSWQC